MISSDAGRRIVYLFLGSAKNSWMKNAIIHLPMQHTHHSLYRHPRQYSYTIPFNPSTRSNNSWILSVSMCDDYREITSSGVDIEATFILFPFFIPIKSLFFIFILFRIVFVNLSSFLNDVLACFFRLVQIELFIIHTHDNKNRLECMHAYRKRTHTLGWKIEHNKKHLHFFYLKKKMKFRAVLHTLFVHKLAIYMLYFTHCMEPFFYLQCQCQTHKTFEFSVLWFKDFSVSVSVLLWMFSEIFEFYFGTVWVGWFSISPLFLLLFLYLSHTFCSFDSRFSLMVSLWQFFFIFHFIFLIFVVSLVALFST